MASKRAYISKSILIKDNSDYFKDALTFLDSHNIKTKFWKQGTTYIPSILNSSNACILLSDPYHYYFGKGSYEELLRAQKLNIPIVLLYQRKSDNTFQFYNITFYQVVNVYGELDYNKYASFKFGDNCTSDFLEQWHDEIDNLSICDSSGSIVREGNIINYQELNEELLLLRRK